MIQPLINLMREQIDEITVQVLKEARKKAEIQTYPWVQRGGSPKQQVILFMYAVTRAKTIAEDLLENYYCYLKVLVMPTTMLSV